jgi:UDPglucose 6-dehydrogenase
VAIKSTVPVGTGDEVERVLRATNPAADVMVVSNPEFMREGSAIDDFKIPDRVVIGANEDRAREIMAEVYRPLNLNKAPLFFTDRRTSEIVKYAANAFLAMKITFINEMADLCERVGADVQDVATASLDNRIGKNSHAGPGSGGSCFPRTWWRCCGRRKRRTPLGWSRPSQQRSWKRDGAENRVGFPMAAAGVASRCSA